MAINPVTEVTPEKKEKFLKALRQVPNVTRAARMARMSRKTAYKHREDEQEFADAWDEALQEGIEALEETCWRDAQKGNTALMIFLLKAHKPEKYRDDYEHHHDGKVIVEVVRKDANARG